MVSPSPDTAPGALRGNVEGADRGGVLGWVVDEGRPGEAVALEILADGQVAGHIVADHHRADLEQAGVGNGRCGFVLRFSPRLAADRRHLVQVRRQADGRDLPGSPLLLDRLEGLEAAAGVLAEAAMDEALRTELAAYAASRTEMLGALRRLLARAERRAADT